MDIQVSRQQESQSKQLEVNGVQLGYLQSGRRRMAEEIEQPVIVFIHGFTGCAASWAPFLDKYVEQGMHVIALEMLGHGNSTAPEDPKRYAMEYCQADIVAALRQLGIGAGKAILVGYSMGGRIALYCGLSGYFRALVLESASPGLASVEERQQRQRSDEAIANCIEEYGMEAFVDYWENRPLFASQVHLSPKQRAALRDQRLHNSTRGLANSLRGVGTGIQPALYDRLSEIALPVLLITGATDEKFCGIAHEMAAILPQAHHQIIPGAGHTAHFEQPEVFEASIRNFCGSVQ